jgi:gamma-D-glutamyl-L-lysine dipeptidyl-peptidase
MLRAAALATLAIASLALQAQPIEVESEIPFVPEGRPLEGLVITLDPGHGGFSTQPGYSGSARGTESRVVEGDLNMLAAAQLRHHLIRGGATVHMTRWDDRKVTLGDSGRAEELGSRPALAEETESHLFLSLHHNAFREARPDRVVILIWPTDSRGEEQPLEVAFADCLGDEIQRLVHHRADFSHYVHEHPLVQDSDIPSAVVEFGFLTNPEFDAWVSQQGSHRAEAIGVYNAVVRMWSEHSGALEAQRLALFPDAEPQLGGNENIRLARPPIESLAERLWPHSRPPRTAEDALHLIDVYRSAVIDDRTFFLLDVDVERTGRTWRLTGQVNHPIHLQSVAALLEAAGCTPIVNEIELLPSAALGAERFGVVQIPMAMTYGVPRMGGWVQTQLLLGERVWLLDVSEDGEQLLHMASDGYIGWVRREAIRRMDSREFLDWQITDRAILTREVMIDALRLPTGAALPLLGMRDGTARLRLPMGVRSTDGAEEVEVPLDALRLPPEESLGRRAAEIATQFLTIPYVFGGRSGGQGLDCSGLSGVVYQAMGIRLPRDARQQIQVGEMVSTAWRRGPLRPGDILFFLDPTGRVSHEAVSLGGLRFIHASPPEVQVNSLDPQDPLHSAHWAERYAFARRIVE